MAEEPSESGPNAGQNSAAQTPQEDSPLSKTEPLKNTLTRRWHAEGRWPTIQPIRDQMMRVARAKGLTTEEAREVVYTELARLYPPLGEEQPATALGPTEPTGDVTNQPTTPPTEPPAEPQRTREAESGVIGLAAIPAAWPPLPPNASLAAEIQWVQSSRLDVVEELPSGAVRVHLDRADRPAPSKAAIGWLETSIRAYAKYCDIAAKATAQAEDEREHVRREKLAIGEVRGLLSEMQGE